MHIQIYIYCFHKLHITVLPRNERTSGRGHHGGHNRCQANRLHHVVSTIVSHKSCHDTYIARSCLQSNYVHYNDVTMSSMASQITSLTIFFFNRLFMRRTKKSPASLAIVCGITRKKFPFDDVIMRK